MYEKKGWMKKKEANWDQTALWLFMTVLIQRLILENEMIVKLNSCVVGQKEGNDGKEEEDDEKEANRLRLDLPADVDDELDVIDFGESDRCCTM